MAKRGVSTVFVLLFLVMPLSGCLSQEGLSAQSSNDADENSETSLPFTEDGIYTCVEHDNLTRCWQTHIPENLDPSLAVPLVVDMHGFGSDSTEQRHLSAFDTISEEDNMIVVYPDGTWQLNEFDGNENQAWNAGWCCAHAATEDIDDVGFIEKMVAVIIQNHNIDTDRIYASGWSNGCAMSQRLAMESHHIFTAVGCMSMYLVTDYVEGYAPIPVMEVHGFLDQVVLYESTVLSVPFNPEMWTNPESYDTGAIENAFEWAEYNNCSGGLETFDTNELFLIQGFSNCENDAQIRLMTIYAAQHNPYANNLINGGISNVFQGTQGIVQSTEHVWEFMSQFSKAEVSE